MSSVPRTPDSSHATKHELSVATPYRLDLTVSALRRTAANPVDVYTAEGQYLRALGGFGEPVVVSVTQPRADALAVSVVSSAADTDRALAIVRRLLGTERDVSEFQRRAQAIPWLAPLARRMLGLKPPRYPALFEACANVIVFQQLSLQSASAIMGRLLRDLGTTVQHDGVSLAVFPSAEAFLRADDVVLQRAGLSAGKLATLRRVAEAIASGGISEPILEQRSSADASVLLQEIKGIGPWSATVILLRGLGRLDVFPPDDSSVAANFALVGGGTVDAGSVVEALGSQRGMLYFLLLLARLEDRGEIGRPTVALTR